MDYAAYLVPTNSIWFSVMAWMLWRCHNHAAALAEEIKKLTILLTVPVNAMFDDVKAGRIALTQAGEEAKSALTPIT